MNFEEFEDKFKPLNNHIAEANNPSADGHSHAPMGGIMFETYGEEFAHVQAQDAENVWTVVLSDEEEEDGIDSVWYICKGFHIVNRLGYIITEEPWTDDDEDAEY